MKKKICLAVIMALLIIGSLNIVKGLTATELEQRRAELKNKINEAGKSIENINIELTENLEAINKLDEEIYSYETQINTISENLENIEKQIKETEDYLDTIQVDYEHQKEVLQERLLYAYEEGPTRYLDVLLNSKSMLDFITNYYLIAELMQYDKDLLDGIERDKEQIEQIEQSLNESKENLKLIKNEQKKIAISLEKSDRSHVVL